MYVNEPVNWEVSGDVFVNAGANVYLSNEFVVSGGGRFVVEGNVRHPATNDVTKAINVTTTSGDVVVESGGLVTAS